jgi:hypothetical protein
MGAAAWKLAFTSASRDLLKPADSWHSMCATPMWRKPEGTGQRMEAHRAKLSANTKKALASEGFAQRYRFALQSPDVEFP